METSSKNITELLRQISALSAHYRELSRLSGEDFNIFRVINLTTKEVAVHSAFIAELLNPRGSHGQGSIFLELFVKQFGITFFDCSNAKAVTEKSIGDVTETTGGQIDIMISDGISCVVIENKIYADDQQNQLIRYHNHCKQHKFHKLLYLTLDGRIASGESTGNILQEEEEQKNAESTYKSISYRDDIIRWLEACRKEAATLPILREGITHYINLIKFLTDQSINKTMEKEIKEIIKNPEYFKAMPDIIAAYEHLKSDIYGKFFTKFETIVNAAPDRFQVVLPEDSTKAIQLTAGEDSCFYFAYRLVNKDNTKKCRFKGLKGLKTQLEEKDISKRDDKASIFKQYSLKLKEVIGVEAEETDWSLAWYCPLKEGKIKLEKLEHDFLSFLDDEKLTFFIEKLLERSENELNKLRESIG